MKTTKDKPIVRELPEDYRKFVEWLQCEGFAWSYMEKTGRWVNIVTDERKKTTDELYQFYLIGK